MVKLILDDINNLIDATTAKTTINTNSARIEAAVENTLSRDGTSPNQMAAPLDMNSNQIINLPKAATNNSPLRMQDLIDFNETGTITNIPSGGTADQVLTKNTDTDYDIAWKTPDLHITAGSNISITGANNVVSTITDPVFNSVTTTKLKNTSDLLLPTTADTLVGRNTIDTLTNKTIDASQLTGTVSSSRLPALVGDVTTSTGSAVTSIGNDKVTNSMLVTVPDFTLKSNISGSTANPSDNTITSVMDKQFGSTQGTMIFRGASGWTSIAPGSGGQALFYSSSTPFWATVRPTLTSNTTYYVRTDGSDTNNGLANTAAGAFRTIQKAINTVAASDIGIFNVIIQVVSANAGTGGAVVNGPWVGSGTVTLQGDTTTPSNVTLSLASDCIKVNAGGRLTVTGFKLTTSSGSLVTCDSGTLILGVMEYGAASLYQVFASGRGASIVMLNNYTISGGAVAHLASLGSISGTSLTVTLTGTPAFTQFAFATRTGLIIAFSNTYTGSATGSRYTFDTGAVIYTAGGATYFPGSTAGTGTSFTGTGLYV